MDEKYKIRIDSCTEKEWYQILERFDDACIYQTWAYEKIRHGIENMSHIIIQTDDKIVSVAQARIITIPIVNIKLAYFYWGPIWRKKNKKQDVETFRFAIKAIKHEYVEKRGFVVRIRPCLFNKTDNVFLTVLEDEGYKQVNNDEPKRTILLDISHSLDDLRKGLDKRWRRQLKIAEKNNIVIEDSYKDSMFKDFIDVYMEMVHLKKFIIPTDINLFRKILRSLPEEFKPRIILCYDNNKPCAGAICCTIGNTAMNIYRATNKLGRTNNASYLVQWKVLEWAKENHCSLYNVNGINPETNPGTYQFKKRLCKKYGKDQYYIGQFQTQKNAFYSHIVEYADKLYRTYKKYMKIRSY
jgi:lipid II:glycine glycyltransferase (peptidoglycan interpeptide bridge formation enzyme)